MYDIYTHIYTHACIYTYIIILYNFSPIFKLMFIIGAQIVFLEMVDGQILFCHISCHSVNFDCGV